MLSDCFYNLPGIVAIKDIDHNYIALSKSALNQLFNKQDFVEGLKDSDIPGPISELSEIFIANDKEILQTQKPEKFLDIGVWSSLFSGALMSTKKPYILDGELKGVAIHATPIDANIFKLLRGVLNTDLLKKLNTDPALSMTVGKKYSLLSQNAQYCLYFLMFGLTNREIATHLNCSNRTIEHYIEELKNALNTDKKSSIIDAAISQGFAFDIPDFIFNKHSSFVI